MSTDTSLTSLSPLDGRYASKLLPVAAIFSEDRLIHARITVEITYLLLLSKYQVVRTLTKTEKKQLKELTSVSESSTASSTVKKLETKTHHDVKAVEYYLREQFEKTSLKDCIPYIHFGLTSEDVNNLSYRLMLKEGLGTVLLPQLRKLLRTLTNFSREHSSIAMLARTHGQPAVPTTIGKEFIVFAMRLLKLLQELESLPLTGKCNGAVGNYQAMVIAYPTVPWQKLSQELVENFGFEFSSTTTQINTPDDLIAIFAKLHHVNGVLLDLSQDIWRYISDNWFVQKGKESYVGSSTMPQKINPIEFENAEGNLLLANSFFELFMRKLPVSRLQRDLSESTVIRNIGSAVGHCSLAYLSLQQGISQLAPNRKKIGNELDYNYAILLEAWQTCAKTTGDTTAYEKAATLGKNQTFTKADWQKLVAQITDNAVREKLHTLTPANYLGLAQKITDEAILQIELYFSQKK